jgi:hypothetical protein
MLDDDKRTKPRYETPTIVVLGELARGAGACTGGNSDTDTCTAGYSALTACTAGNAAQVACTAGTAALSACEMGGHL